MSRLRDFHIQGQASRPPTLPARRKCTSVRRVRGRVEALAAQPIGGNAVCRCGVARGIEQSRRAADVEQRVGGRGGNQAWHVQAFAAKIRVTEGAMI